MVMRSMATRGTAMREGVVAFFLAGLFLPLLCWAVPALQASPDTVQLCGGGAAQYVRIAATTEPKTGLAGSVVRWHSAAGVDVSLEPVARVPSRGSGSHGSGLYATWLLKVSAPAGAPEPGVVQVFLVDESAPSSPQVLAGTSFKVENAIAADAFPAKVDLDSAWQSLNEGQRAAVQATLTNQSGATLQVIGMRVSAGPFDVAQSLVGAAMTNPVTYSKKPVLYPKKGSEFILPVANQELAPGSVFLHSFDVAVGQYTAPSAGAHRLLLSVDLAGTVNGCKRVVTLVAHKDIGFAVLGGESILTAVGIPSFLLVPGFLMLMAMVLLWKLGLRPRRVAAATAFPFPPKEAEFWVLAITLSLLLVLLPSAPGRFANYRIDNVAHTWLGSLAAAAFAYLLFVLAINSWDARRDAQALSEGDSAEAALRKLAKLTKSTFAIVVLVDLAKAGIGAGRARRFLPKRMSGSAWTIPLLVFDWIDAGDADTLKAIELARQQRDLPRLADVLLKAVAASRITLEWDPQSTVKHPARIVSEALTESGEAEFIQEKE
jgi:hypothetical protein